MKKKIFAAALACVMTFSLAACGTKQEEVKEEVSAASEAVSEAAPSLVYYHPRMIAYRDLSSYPFRKAAVFIGLPRHIDLCCCRDRFILIQKNLFQFKNHDLTPTTSLYRI